MSKIIITEFMDEPAIDLIREHHQVVYSPTLVDQPDALIHQLKDVDALIVRNRTQVTADLLAHAPRLRVIGRLGVGLDNIDVPTAEARRIRVIPATGANALAVAEYVITTALILLRGAYFSSDAVSVGRWPRQALSGGFELHGKQLGLIGFGSIGQQTAALAKALGVRVVACDPTVPAQDPRWLNTGVQAVTLDTLLATSDIVSLHVPLLSNTRQLLNADRLARLKTGAVLINTARGGIVDEQALIQRLQQHLLAGAALDVFAEEPLPTINGLQQVPNLILTPHIAGVTVESNQRVSQLIAKQVNQFLTETEQAA